MSDFFVSKQDKVDLGFLRPAVNTGSGNTYAQWKIASSGKCPIGQDERGLEGKPL